MGNHFISGTSSALPSASSSRSTSSDPFSCSTVTPDVETWAGTDIAQKIHEETCCFPLLAPNDLSAFYDPSVEMPKGKAKSKTLFVFEPIPRRGKDAPFPPFTHPKLVINEGDAANVVADAFAGVIAIGAEHKTALQIARIGTSIANNKSLPYLTNIPQSRLRRMKARLGRASRLRARRLVTVPSC